MTNQQPATSNQQPATSNLTRSVLERLPKTPLHTARNWSKAEVWLAEWPPDSGRRVVVKDFRSRPLWFRVMGARHTLQREWQAMVALDDLPVVPGAVARPDADVIVIEYRAGTPIKDFKRGTVSPAVLEQLETLITEMHRRGVTHGDLHGANILVDEQGTVSVIDWATASFFGDDPRGPKAASFAQWRALDERSLIKLKLLHAPQEISGRERQILMEGPSRLYRFVKRLRYLVAKLRGKKPSREFMFTGATARRLLEEADETANSALPRPLPEGGEKLSSPPPGEVGRGL